jgi:SAM-dependent methyltransferase
LSYPDSYFDLVYSISVLEHIPGDGDTIASKEISRVLRSGGIAIIEVPFSNKEYDTYVNKDVYERKYIEKPVFYQRHYNGNTIYKRIINPTELFIERIVIVSEELPFELIMGKLNTFLQIPLLFISPILSIINHKKVELRVLNPYQESHRGKAKSIILFFKKL